MGGCCGIRRNSDAVEGAPEVCRLPLRLAASLWAPLTSALLLFATAGCGSRVSDEELGRIVPGPPPIPSGYEPYELPDLTPSPGDATDGSATPEEPPASASEQPGESMEELAQPVAPADAPASPPSAPGPPDATIRDADA